MDTRKNSGFSSWWSQHWGNRSIELSGEAGPAYEAAMLYAHAMHKVLSQKHPLTDGARVNAALKNVSFPAVNLQGDMALGTDGEVKTEFDAIADQVQEVDARKDKCEELERELLSAQVFFAFCLRVHGAHASVQVHLSTVDLHHLPPLYMIR